MWPPLLSIFAGERDLWRVVFLLVTKSNLDATTGFRWWGTQHTIYNIQCMHSIKMSLSLSL